MQRFLRLFAGGDVMHQREMQTGKDVGDGAKVNLPSRSIFPDDRELAFELLEGGLGRYGVRGGGSEDPPPVVT